MYLSYSTNLSTRFLPLHKRSSLDMNGSLKVVDVSKDSLLFILILGINLIKNYHTTGSSKRTTAATIKKGRRMGLSSGK